MKMWWLAAAMMAFLVPGAAAAQAAAGLRAGARTSQLETSGESGSLSSFIVAAYFGIGISNRLALQIEGIYGSRGADALRVGQGVLADTAGPARVEMSYTDIPILLRTAFPAGRFLPSFYVGPYVGILMGCDLTPEGESPRDCDTADVAQRFRPRATDFGLTMGGSLDYLLGETTVFIDARYSLGLLSIQTGDDAFDARHTGLSISGGFAFPLGS